MHRDFSVPYTRRTMVLLVEHALTPIFFELWTIHSKTKTRMTHHIDSIQICDFYPFLDSNLRVTISHPFATEILSIFMTNPYFQNHESYQHIISCLSHSFPISCLCWQEVRLKYKCTLYSCWKWKQELKKIGSLTSRLYSLLFSFSNTNGEYFTMAWQLAK